MASKDRQVLPYTEEKRVDCVVSIVKVLGRCTGAAPGDFNWYQMRSFAPTYPSSTFVAGIRVMGGTTESLPLDIPGPADSRRPVHHVPVFRATRLSRWKLSRAMA